MSFDDQVILALNLLGAATATVVLALARNRVSPGLRPVAYVVGFLSSVYVVGYVVLLAWSIDSEPDAAQIVVWSQVMRGVGVAAWPIAWIWVWLELIRAWREVKSGIAPIEDQVLLAERVLPESDSDPLDDLSRQRLRVHRAS